MKRVLSVLLSLVLVLGTLPSAFAAEVQAEAPENAQGDFVTAQELPDSSRLKAELGGKNLGQVISRSDNEIVTIIVELDAPALLDTYSYAPHTRRARSTAGADLSSYLAAPVAASQADALLLDQALVYKQICGLMGYDTTDAYGSDRGDTASGPIAQWTTIFNGMAVRAPYGLLDEIRKIPGVKDAHEEVVYSLPEPVGIGQPGQLYGYSYDMVNLEKVWAKGYTGQNMLVSILDTGLDLDNTINLCHEAFRADSFRTEAGKRDLRYPNAASLKTDLHANGADLFKSEKVPFGYDYADMDTNVRHTAETHGTHVAGTVAGYAKSKEGAVTFSGIAPDAQILVMKVFGDKNPGAPEAAILNALEDSMKLGADVVNLSLGSPNGFATGDPIRLEVYQRLKDAGVVIMIAAGNEGPSTNQNNFKGSALPTNPDISMVGSPSVYSPAMSVASINNTVNTQIHFTWGTDNKVPFTSPDPSQIKNELGDQAIRVIPVGNSGNASGYEAAGFKKDGTGVTGIALVQRGGTNEATGEAITFVEKVYNGQLYGAKAVLIYDNQDSPALINMAMEDKVTIPSGFISKANGDALVAACKQGEVKITVQKKDGLYNPAEGGKMSDFTSWGSAPGLELKPEITAPGGNIWSAVQDTIKDDYTGSYSMMSGTSMATPHMTGLAALVEQYVRKDLQKTGTAAADLTNHLLVSTAVPQKDETNTNYYSPRRQGAGLVDVDAALRTPAYVAVDGKLVGKLELMDDPQWTGSYPLKFRVENLKDQPLTYNVKVVVMTPAVNGNGLMETRDEILETVDMGQINVPANSSAAFDQILQLKPEQIAKLKASFPNGTFAEGFVLLTDAAGTNPQLSVPFMGFLGDWTKAPVFDSLKWTDDLTDQNFVTSHLPTWGVSTFCSTFKAQDDIKLLQLGQNPFDTNADPNAPSRIHDANIAISPNGDNLFEAVDYPVLYQLRDARLMVFEIRDKTSGEIYYQEWVPNFPKTHFDPRTNSADPISTLLYPDIAWGGTNAQKELLPSGTQCVYTVTAYNDGTYPQTQDEHGNPDADYGAVATGTEKPTFNSHEMSMDGDVFTFSVTVDYGAPTLENGGVRVYEENGHTYLSGKIEDKDGSLSILQIVPAGVENAPALYDEVILDAAVKTREFKVDVTDYLEKNPSIQWNGSVEIYGADYAGNIKGYSVKVSAEAGLTLSHNTLHLLPNDVFTLGVTNNTGSDAALTYTSSKNEVATVDSQGLVTAVAPGQSVITVSNGRSSATCVVIVEDPANLKVDFQLSPSSVTGMLPESTLEIRFTNMVPSDLISQVVPNVEVIYPDGTAGSPVDCELKGSSIFVKLNDPKAALTSFTVRVTILDIVRDVKVDLAAASPDQNGLIPANGGSQIIYVTQGETASLAAAYKTPPVVPQNVSVVLYTAVDYDGANNMPTTPAAGLTLNGAPTVPVGGQWTGTLTAQDGHTLPDSIRVFERTERDGTVSETEQNAPYFTYDKDTGAINVPVGPASADVTLVIRADGAAAPVPSTDATAPAEPGTETPAPAEPGTETPDPVEPGTETPDPNVPPTDGDESPAPVTDEPTHTIHTLSSMFGYTTTDDAFPVDQVPSVQANAVTWTVVSGDGVLTPSDLSATFTPNKPGEHVIQVTDGTYSLNFTVVSLPILAKTITLTPEAPTVRVGETTKLEAKLDPVPTAGYGDIRWTSFDETIAKVDANGVVTGISKGEVYIQAETTANAQVKAGCVVKVAPAKDPDPIDPFPPYIPPYIPPYVPTEPESKPNVPDPNVPPTPPAFVDIAPTHWAYDSIAKLVSLGAINGVSPNEFAPNDMLDRAMLVTILWRLEGQPAASSSGQFNDISGDRWYTAAVEWASSNGIVNGNNGKFSPHDKITREQIATILWRSAGSPSTSYDLKHFADGSTVSNFAETAMRWAVENHLFRGNENGQLRPDAPASRAEAAAILDRFISLG